MTPTICVVGRSNCGKTTVITKLITMLKSRGYRVAAIKHAHHGFNADQVGKDSWQYEQAGSDLAGVSEPGRIMMTRYAEDDTSLEDISRLISPEYDVILAEGFKSSTLPKIHLFREETGYDLLCSQEDLLALVSDKSMPYGVPRFAPDDIEGISQLIETAMLTIDDTKAPETELRVNGKNIPLSEFLQNFFAQTLQGMISSLKGIPDSPETIEISVKLPAKQATQTAEQIFPEILTVSHN